MPATRILIDLQPHFSAANRPKVLIAAIQETIKAIKEGAAIILVEFAACGQTHGEIKFLLRGYKNFTVIRKYHNDGSEEIVKALDKHKFPYRYLRVFGVNSDCCLQETVEGLHEILPSSKIKIVRDACATRTDGYTWKRFPRMKNVSFV